MNKILNWVLTQRRAYSRSANRANSLCFRSFLAFVAILVCGASVLVSCHKAQTQQEESPAAQVVNTELIRTSQSWDGVELPDYLQGRPELVAVKYVFPAGKKLGWHHHPVMNYGILVQGELTIIGQDGKEKVVHEGEAVVEMVNTIHHGENRGTKDVILYMFYLSQKDMPLAVQHPEIPMD
jgi:quercetin dioxygenase-like cupin family protein